MGDGPQKAVPPREDLAIHVHHMRVDHRRLDLRVSQVLLNLADIHAAQGQVRRERVPQGVNRRRCVDTRRRRGGPDGLLEHRLVEAMAPDDACARVGGERPARQHPEPPPLTPGVRVLPFECIRYPHALQARESRPAGPWRPLATAVDPATPNCCPPSNQGISANRRQPQSATRTVAGAVKPLRENRRENRLRELPLTRIMPLAGGSSFRRLGRFQTFACRSRSATYAT